jgi:hypothetical protein
MLVGSKSNLMDHFESSIILLEYNENKKTYLPENQKGV